MLEQSRDAHVYGRVERVDLLEEGSPTRHLRRSMAWNTATSTQNEVERLIAWELIAVPAGQGGEI